jgi:carbon-monoxide dehydrogenase medium subunit
MKPAPFEYRRPETLEEALALLQEHGDEAKVLAGGQSLVPVLNMRLLRPSVVVDVNALPGLDHVEAVNGHVRVGALVRQRALEASPLTPERLPLVAEALPHVGHFVTRGRGTIGGSIAHADPASDLPAVLLALEATVVARSQKGDRSIPITSFFRGPFQTALADNEIITEIRLPAPSEGYGSAYVNIEQPASGYAIAGVAAVLGHSGGVMGSTIIEDVRVGITGVADHAYRASAVENALRGTDCSRDRIARASEQAAQGVEVNSDIHADREYRTAMAQVLARRAIEAARARSA